MSRTDRLTRRRAKHAFRLASTMRLAPAGRADDSRPTAASAGRAPGWQAPVHYGLWRVNERKPGSRLECADILSGRVRRVEFPPEILAGLVRWAVWYGGVAPLDGAWQAAGPGARLSPAEADAAAELILTGTAQARLGTAAPRGVSVDYDPEPPDHAALTVSQVAGAVMDRVLGEIGRYRAAPLVPVNSSDEPVRLITARFTVTSPERLRVRLLQRDDFRGDPGSPGLIRWSESAVAGTPGASLGTLLIDPADATVPTGPEVVAHVDSAARFAYLQTLLAKLDPDLTVRHEKHVDPGLHTAWPGLSASPALVPAEDWELCWLDQPLAVLGCQSPRRAAGTRYLPELMTLIRQFEYQAGLLALEGKSGADTDLIRRELGLTSLR